MRFGEVAAQVVARFEDLLGFAANGAASYRDAGNPDGVWAWAYTGPGAAPTAVVLSAAPGC